MPPADFSPPKASPASSGPAHHAPRRPKGRGIALGLALGAGLGLGAYGLWRARLPQLHPRRWRIQPKLWRGHEPLRLVAVSLAAIVRSRADLRRFEALLRRIDRLGADAVVILDLDLVFGDAGTGAGMPAALTEAAIDALSRLHGPKLRAFLPDASGAPLLGAAGFAPLSRKALRIADSAGGVGLVFWPQGKRAAAGGAAGRAAEGPCLLFSRDPQAFFHSAAWGVDVPLVVSVPAAGGEAGAAFCAADPARYDETGRTLIRAATALPASQSLGRRALRAAVTLLDLGEPSGW